VVPALDGADAVVFAAGAGPGSGVPRKDTVDRGASVLLADAAERSGAGRFVQISSMGAGAPAPPGTDETFAAYLQAKTAAEDGPARPRPSTGPMLRHREGLGPTNRGTSAGCCWRRRFARGPDQPRTPERGRR
jgi:hypothetical protein